MAHGRLSQSVPIDIAVRSYNIKAAANGATSEQRTCVHEAECQAAVSRYINLITSVKHTKHSVGQQCICKDSATN